MGRDKRNEARTEQFTYMVKPMMDEPAWRALGSSGQALYPWIRLEWRGPRANNNGDLRLSVRQAALKMGIGNDAAARAFQDLQGKGFLFITEPARLGSSGDAKSPLYELTELPLRGASSNVGRKLYQKWSKGKDFPVQRAMANNPTGRNGAKPCHENRDGNVINIVTNRKVTS